MKNIVFSLLAVIAIFYGNQKVSAQSSSSEIDIVYKKTKDGVVILATNPEPIPYSFKFDFQLENLQIRTEEKTFFMVPPQSEEFEITRLDVMKPDSPYNFKYNFKAQVGKTDFAEPDTTFVYALPYPSGKKYEVLQGYNGQFSHVDENALDFNLPKGSKVHAARGGVVAEVIDNNKRHCPRPHCADFNNRVVVYHDDGTMAFYSHLKWGGSKVEKGDAVKQGDLLGYSGNTGFSRGAHLHFEVRIPQWDLLKPIKLRTQFEVEEKDEPVYIKKGDTFTAK